MWIEEGKNIQVTAAYYFSLFLLLLLNVVLQHEIKSQILGFIAHFIFPILEHNDGLSLVCEFLKIVLI